MVNNPLVGNSEVAAFLIFLAILVLVLPSER
jgi:hypothetical protein